MTPKNSEQNTVSNLKVSAQNYIGGTKGNQGSLNQRSRYSGEGTKSVLRNRVVNICSGLIPVRPMAGVCGRSIAWITGMNPAEGMDVGLFCLLRVV
jgi:hypothetical protein